MPPCQVAMRPRWQRSAVHRLVPRPQLLRPSDECVRRRPGREHSLAVSGTGADLAPGRQPRPGRRLHVPPLLSTGRVCDRSGRAAASGSNQWRGCVSRREPARTPQGLALPPAANCWCCTVTPSRCCPQLCRHDRRGRGGLELREVELGGGSGAYRKVPATCRRWPESARGLGPAAGSPDIPQHRQWAIPNRVLWA